MKNITIEKITKGSSVQYQLRQPKTVDLVYEFSRREQRQQVSGKGKASWTQTMQTGHVQQRTPRRNSRESSSSSSESNESRLRTSRSGQQHQQQSSQQSCKFI